MATRLYKDGDRMAIETDADTEGMFLEDFAVALEELIETGRHEHDWEFQFRFWLPEMVDICCAYRGYKNEVVKRTLYIAGEWGLPGQPEVEISGGEVKRLRNAGS